MKKILIYDAKISHMENFIKHYSKDGSKLVFFVNEYNFCNLSLHNFIEQHKNCDKISFLCATANSSAMHEVTNFIYKIKEQYQQFDEVFLHFDLFKQVKHQYLKSENNFNESKYLWNTLASLSSCFSERTSIFNVVDINGVTNNNPQNSDINLAIIKNLFSKKGFSQSASVKTLVLSDNSKIEKLSKTSQILLSELEDAYVCSQAEFYSNLNNNFDKISTPYKIRNLVQSNSQSAKGRPYLSNVSFKNKFLWVHCDHDPYLAARLLCVARNFGAQGFASFTSRREMRKVQSILRANTNFYSEVNKFDFYYSSEIDNEIIESLIVRYKISGSTQFNFISCSEYNSGIFGKSLTDINSNHIDQFFEQFDNKYQNLVTKLQRLYLRVAELSEFTPSFNVFFNDKAPSESSFASLAKDCIYSIIRNWEQSTHDTYVQKFGGIDKKINLISCSSQPHDEELFAVADWVAAISAGEDLYSMNNLTYLETNKIDSANLISSKRDQESMTHLDRVAIVTNGAEGLGREIAKHLFLEGAKVFITDRSNDKLIDTSSELLAIGKSLNFKNPNSRIGLLAYCDILKKESIDHIIADCIKQFGRVDYLINNASIHGAEKSFCDIPIQSWRDNFQGNFFSSYQISQQAIGQMSKNSFGRIINITPYRANETSHKKAPTLSADFLSSKSAQSYTGTLLNSSTSDAITFKSVGHDFVTGSRLLGSQNYEGFLSRVSKNQIVTMVTDILYRYIVKSSKSDSILFLEELCSGDYEFIIKSIICGDALDLNDQTYISNIVNHYANSLDTFFAHGDVINTLRNRILSQPQLTFLHSLARNMETGLIRYFPKNALDNQYHLLVDEILGSETDQALVTDKDFAKLVSDSIEYHNSVGLNLVEAPTTSEFSSKTYSESPSLLSEDQNGDIFIVTNCQNHTSMKDFIDLLDINSQHRVVLISTSPQLQDLESKSLKVFSVSDKADCFDVLYEQAVKEGYKPSLVIPFLAPESNLSTKVRLPELEEIKLITEQTTTFLFKVSKQVSLVPDIKVSFQLDCSSIHDSNILEFIQQCCKNFYELFEQELKRLKLNGKCEFRNLDSRQEKLSAPNKANQSISQQNAS